MLELTQLFVKGKIIPYPVQLPQDLIQFHGLQLQVEPLLMEPEKLDTLPEDADQLSDILQNSTVNYGKYRELQLKFKQWQRWYDINRKLHKDTQEN